MNLNSGEIFRFGRITPWDTILLSGDITYSKPGIINYNFTYSPDGKISGELAIPEELENKILKLCTFDNANNIKEGYVGSLEDTGSSVIEYLTESGSKMVVIDNVYNEDMLETTEEKHLFLLVTELIELSMYIYDQRNAPKA